MLCNDAKIDRRQYVVFIKPQNFDTADIKCFTISLQVDPIRKNSASVESQPAAIKAALFV